MEHPPQADFLFKGQGEGREWTSAKTIQQFLRAKLEGEKQKKKKNQKNNNNNNNKSKTLFSPAC